MGAVLEEVEECFMSADQVEDPLPPSLPVQQLWMFIFTIA